MNNISAFQEVYADLLARAPLPDRSFSPLFGAGVAVPPAPNEAILSVPAPQEGGRADAKGVSWNPDIFRPSKPEPVSCYSGLQFSGDNVEIPVSAKPGQGFKKPECGAWVRTIKAGNEVKKIFHSCDILGCPVCMPGAITRKAQDAADHFDDYEKAKCAENAALIPGEKKGISPRHFAFTISPAHQAALVAFVMRARGKWDEVLFLDIIRDEFRKAVKYAGLIGGISVYHDARVRYYGHTGNRAKHLIILEAKARGNMKDNDPAWKIYDHIRKQQKPGRYYYFSPHFHVLGYGKARDIHEFESLMSGWTYHNKGDADNPGGLLRYLYSHMAMIEDRNSVSWFGRLSSRCLGKEELRTYEKEEKHPETGLPWIIIESVIPSEIGSIFRTSITEYRSFFRSIFLHKPCGESDKLVFPKAKYKRRISPPGVHEKGILALSRYVDEWGKL